MGTTAVSDTATRYWEGAPGAAWPAAPRVVEPNRWDWGFARRQNSTEVNSALSIQSSSPRFCTKTSGGLSLGSKAGGQGPRGMGRAAGTGVRLRHAAFPVRVCQCRGAAPPPCSLAPGARAQGGLSSPLLSRRPDSSTLDCMPSFGADGHVQPVLRASCWAEVVRNPVLFSFPERALSFSRVCQPVREREREREKEAAGSRGEARRRDLPPSC